MAMTIRKISELAELVLLGLAIVAINYLWWKPLFIYVWNYWTN